MVRFLGKKIMAKVFEQTTGTYTGTGAAQTITLGFRPTALIIANITDGDTVVFYFDGMTDATALKMDTAVAAVASKR